jgi:predicted DNA-binding transcriptional regulator YafY
MKTNRITRVLRLLTILQSKENHTSSELARILGISLRTFYRDLKDIKDAGLCSRLKTKNHYYSLESNSDPVIPALSKEEAFSLLLLLLKANRSFSFPYNYAALTAALKIENSLRPAIRQFCSTSLRTISINRALYAINDRLNSVFPQLLEAAQKRQILNIHFSLPFEQRNIVTNFSPYHLFYAEYSWHTIGYSSFHGAVHTFKLSQIERLNPLDKYFVEDTKFDLQEYFGYAWSLLREGQIYSVELKFSPEIAEDVAETQWHETQTVSFNDNGSVTLKFRVDGLDEITWWILSYGDRVEVLKPLVLRRRIAEIAMRMANSVEKTTVD